MKKNMFNTVKKGIIRSAALLLVAGFCGNVSADYTDFKKAIAKGDFTDPSKVEETIKSFNAKITKGDSAYNVINLDEIDSKITENAELSGIFAGVLQKNYEISEILKHLATNEKDPKIKLKYDAALKNFDYNLLNALLKGKMPNGKISDKDEADFIKVAYRSFYSNAGNLLATYRTKGVVTSEINFLQDKLNNATQALKDINNAINNHGVEIDDLNNTDETATNVQTAIDSLVTEAANAQTAKADAENNLTALLDWNDKDKNPAVANFGGSALKVFVEELKKAVVDLNTVSLDQLENNPEVNGLIDNLDKVNNTKLNLENEKSDLESNLNKLNFELSILKNDDKKDLELQLYMINESIDGLKYEMEILLDKNLKQVNELLDVDGLTNDERSLFLKWKELIDSNDDTKLKLRTQSIKEEQESLTSQKGIIESRIRALETSEENSALLLQIESLNKQKSELETSLFEEQNRFLNFMKTLECENISKLQGWVDALAEHMGLLVLELNILQSNDQSQLANLIKEFEGKLADLNAAQNNSGAQVDLSEDLDKIKFKLESLKKIATIISSNNKEELNLIINSHEYGIDRLNNEILLTKNKMNLIETTNQVNKLNEELTQLNSKIAILESEKSSLVQESLLLKQEIANYMTEKQSDVSLIQQLEDQLAQAGHQGIIVNEPTVNVPLPTPAPLHSVDMKENADNKTATRRPQIDSSILPGVNTVSSESTTVITPSVPTPVQSDVKRDSDNRQRVRTTTINLSRFKNILKASEGNTDDKRVTRKPQTNSSILPGMDTASYQDIRVSDFPPAPQVEKKGSVDNKAATRRPQIDSSILPGVNTASSEGTIVSDFSPATNLMSSLTSSYSNNITKRAAFPQTKVNDTENTTKTKDEEYTFTDPWSSLSAYTSKKPL